MKKIIHFTLIGLVTCFLFSCEKKILIEPQLISSADTLVFNGARVMELIISTKPASICEYKIISSPDWLNISPKSGIIDNNLKTLQITSDFSTYLPGIYEGKIDIMSTSGNKTIYVKGIVNEQLSYYIPDSLIFSVCSSKEQISIKNEGNIPLNYSITTSNNFISTSNLSGNVLVGEQSDIAFLVNRNNMLTDTYSSQIYLNINNKLDTINVSIENFIEHKKILSTNIIDAEYSRVKDILVYVASTPSSINIYNASSEIISSINLNYKPTCVSISSDGNTAVVGHDGFITYVDLSSKKIIKSFTISCYAADIVLSNNKWAYIFPKGGDWNSFRCVNVDLSYYNEVLHIGDPITAQTKAKLHPSGKYIYGTTNTMVPSDIEKYDIQKGRGTYLYDCEYHGDYPINGNLWFSEDGSRVFTKGKTVLKVSEIQEQDMVYNGSISLGSTGEIMWLEHSSARNNLYIIATENNSYSSPRQSFIYVFDANNLDYKFKYTLEKYLMLNNNGEMELYDAEPLFVFINSDGNKLMVLTQAKNYKLTNKWAVQKIIVE